MIKANQLKSIQIGYGDQKVIFHPRMISVAEEEEINAKINDISSTDEDRYDKTYELLKEALGEFSIEVPQTLAKEKGEFKRVPLVENAGTPTEAIQQFFSERTIENERVIRTAFLLLKNQLSPDSLFL